MSKCRSMYAGSSGYNYGANTHSEGNGNGFLQGLVSTVNKRAGLIKFIRTEAGGQNRDMVFCLNQLGGVGKRSNMFASNADGVKQPCQGSENNAVIKALETLYEAFLDGKAGTGDGEINEAEAEALGISPQVFQQILNLCDNDGDNEVDKDEVYQGLISYGENPDVDLGHGLWLETPGKVSGDLYTSAMRDNVDNMKSWIAGLKTIIEQQKITRLVVRLCNITASWAVDITDPDAPLHYWQRVSNDGTAAAGQGGGADIGSKIYSLEKDPATNKFYEYSLAWLIKECGITELLWAPLVSETVRFAGPNATGGDIRAFFTVGGNYTKYTNPLSDGSKQARQIYEDTKFMVKCIQKYRDVLGGDKIKTGILWEVENRGAQWLFCNDRKEREWKGGDVVTFNPIYDMSRKIGEDFGFDENWTFALCPFVKPGKESATAITIASLWASAVNYNVEVFPQWYGMKSFLKSGPDCAFDTPTLINSGRDDPENITEKIKDELQDYNDDEREVGNALSEIDTPFIADLQMEDSIYNYWKGIWRTASQTPDTPSSAPTGDNYFNKIIQLVPTLTNQKIEVPSNFRYTALVSIESFFFGGGCNGYPKQWTFNQIDGFSQEVANIVGWGYQFNTMYFQASYLFPGANNQTDGPEPAFDPDQPDKHKNKPCGDTNFSSPNRGGTCPP